ncbi:MAG: hypothetical protein FWG75_05160 [Cystobacterineae bacterium]|nr:hypothetical protein [Cystobacterineae bacterium]
MKVAMHNMLEAMKQQQTQTQARAQMSNGDYASMLNGMTTAQLKQEQASQLQQLKTTAPGSPQQAAALEKYNLASKELNSRPSDFFEGFVDNMSRTMTQQSYKQQPTEALQQTLAELKSERAAEQEVVAKARELGFKGTSQFDSNYDKDSTLEKQIGAIEAELTMRGAPLVAGQSSPSNGIDVSKLFDIAANALSGQSSSSNGVDNGVQNTTTAPPSFEQQVVDHLKTIQKYADLLDTAAKGSTKNGEINKKDLQSILDNPGIPTNLKDACKFLLDNDAIFRQLDVSSDNQNFNDKFSKKGLENMIKRYSDMIQTQPASTPQTQAPTQTAPVSTPPVRTPTFAEQRRDAINQISMHFDMLDTAAGIGRKDGKISEKDLNAALKDKNLPPALRNAIEFLLANPSVRNELDVGAGKGKVDGIISKKDVEAMRKKYC